MPSSQKALRSMMDKDFMKRTYVLLVDDDSDLRHKVKDYLAAEGYNVLEANSLKSTLDVLQSHQVKAIVLDVGLPDGNGLDALPELRRHTNCPIVILTAWGQLPMRLKGLANGADYYLVKPVPLAELSAVLKAQLRRNTSDANWRTEAATQTLIGALGDSVHLTSSEWLFVKALRKSPGKITDRQELARALGHDPDVYDLRRMDMLVRRLRLKVEAAGLGELPLHTRHGQGYVWDER
jgi:DNA-binding response OmpR family regulator